MALIRPSCDADLPSITALYTHHVRHGTGTFETECPSVQEMLARRADVLAKQLPYLVLVDAGELQGFAYGNWFKPRAAYRYSMEDSIYMAAHAQGRGWGRALLAELLSHCRRSDVRTVMAIIGDSANTSSIGLHESLGFSHVGVVPACGWKLGAWRDIVIMQKTLGAGGTAPPASLSPLRPA